jgi:hypothetical protein
MSGRIIGNSGPVKDFPLTRFGCQCLAGALLFGTVSVGSCLTAVVLDSKDTVDVVDTVDTADTNYLDDTGISEPFLDIGDSVRTVDTNYDSSVNVLDNWTPIDQNAGLGVELFGIYSKFSSLEGYCYDLKGNFTCVD